MTIIQGGPVRREESRDVDREPGPAGRLVVFSETPELLALAVDAARHVGARLVLSHGLPASFAGRSVGLRTALEDVRRLLDVAPPAALGLVAGSALHHATCPLLTVRR